MLDVTALVLTDHETLRRQFAALDDARTNEAVGVARTENSKHLAEEEREALPDFRKSASDSRRESLAVEWLAWRFERVSGRGVTTRDTDPDRSLESHS